ncbi:hypothetical protein [Pseudonocardia aurantiaca]|uniref:Uncharacterized protein n=1 Tax=Pseudonocardia aurantiaca TaxID=75290 RepID=A0ABW4FK85_9PSEU
MAGYLVGEDADVIFVADLQGTWVLPHGSYDDLSDWAGGENAPEMFEARGRPVQLALREGAVIHELRPYTVRKGGDPIAGKKNRKLIREIFSADGRMPDRDVSMLGEERLLRLEEALGRRLGWDPEKPVGDQVFFAHHLRAASWNCGSDGGGS